MTQVTFSTIYRSISSYIWVSLLLNTFALKLFIDMGNYNIIGPFLFVHFIFCMLQSIFLSVYFAPKQAIKMAALHALLAWPALSLIILHGTVTFFHIGYYFLFLYSMFVMISFLQPVLYSEKKWHHLLNNLVFLFFLWGTNLIIETIPFLYDFFAPLTVAYHYLLVAEGILHIGTPLYMATIVMISYGFSHVKKQI